MSISGSEIPTVSVRKPPVLRHGDDFTIVCNVTAGQGLTPFMRISWLKDGALMQSVLHPDPKNAEITLIPLVLRNIDLRDGGEYTCLLEVLLRNVKEHNVSAATTIHSKYAYIVKSRL